MTKIFKKHHNQSILFSIGLIFCCSLSAENISQDQHKFTHKNKALTCETTNIPIGIPQIVSSKFLVGDKGFKHNNVLKNSHKPKSSSIIDHQIFASPKSIKPTKRILI